MEENQTSSFKVALNYALITGALLIILDLIFYVMDTPIRSEIRFISWLIYLGGIIWGQKVFRDVHSNGLITYGKSFSVGFTVGFFAALLVAVYTFVFIKFFDNEVIRQSLETAEQQLLESGDLNDQQIDQALSMTEKFTTPFTIAAGALVFGTIGITILSLITSIFIRKEENL